MSLRKFDKRHSSKWAFGSINKMSYSPGYYLVIYLRGANGKLIDAHRDANNLRIAKKKMQEALRGQHPLQHSR